MPREIAIFGAYVPALLLLTVLAGAVTLVLDRLLARIGWYDLVWHPSLFRVSLFVCLTALLGRAAYP